MDFSWIEDPEQRAKAEEDYKKSLEDRINEEVQGLKSKNEELLREKKTVAEKLEEIKTKTDGIDIEKAKEMMKKLEENKRANLLEDGKLEEYVQAEVQNKERELENKYQTQIEVLAQEKDTVFQTANKYENLYKNKIVEDALRSVAMESGCIQNESVVQDIIMRGKQMFSLTENETGIEARDADGKLRKTKSGDKILTPMAWAEDLKSECPHYFPASAGTGASGGSSSSSNTSDDLQKRMQEALSDGNMSLYKKLRNEQGARFKS